MNVVIEVAAMTLSAEVISPKVKAQKAIFLEVVTLVSVVATSVLRALRQGRSSQNAVSPVHTLIEGGLAVA
jgi:hypothetical protein